MSPLPRVTESTRERVCRDFDHFGPEACIAEILKDLKERNPELLDMATKCAADVGDPSKIMVGFGMFYRLLVAESPPAGPLSPLPRVTAGTRDLIVAHIDQQGAEAFTVAAIEDLERDNPELLQMAHGFASRHADYLRIMQGFVLLYRALVLQSIADRAFMQ